MNLGVNSLQRSASMILSGVSVQSRPAMALFLPLPSSSKNKTTILVHWIGKGSATHGHWLPFQNQNQNIRSLSILADT